MTILSNRKSAQRKKRTIAIAIGVLVILVILSRFSFFSPLSSVFHAITLPLWKAKISITDTVRGVTSSFASKRSLVEENELLRERLNEFEISFQYNDVIVEENKKLKELFNRSNENEEDLTVASILTKPNQSPYGTLIIDIGSDSGVEVGDYIIARGNVVLGEIKDVFSNSSRVTLFSKSGNEIEGILSEFDIFVTLTGKGSGNFEFTIPRDIEIIDGLEVIIPSINSYLIADVRNIVRDPRDPLQKIVLASPVNIQELRFVQVLKK
ncbi:hypothetical protein COB64_03725 [Candidatus Wolfebacteria bacterium]|nr:MAG: hypothetical protein COB64_03725 [Candidatus Wolfebacteria bacterium]